MKKITALLLLLACMLSFSLPVSAAVITTKEPTAKDCIYIAGNPDLYPLEYYNEEAKCYQGILPQLYEDISRETGINFAYVAADSESRQKELAENLQVEIVSAYLKGEISPKTEIELFSYTDAGKTCTVCIGLTQIAEAAVVQTLTSAMATADKNTWLAAAMSLEQHSKADGLLWYLLVALGVLALAVIGLTVWVVKTQKRKKEQERTKAIDPLTGIGNLLYFEDCFKHHISEAIRPLYYIAYIAADIEKIETYFGGPQAEELQRYIAATISETIGDNDFAGRIDNGVFALAYMAPDRERALEFATTLTETLDAYQGSGANENGIGIHCGVYPLEGQRIGVETAIQNARQGCLFAQQEHQPVCLCDSAVLGRVTRKSYLQKKLSSAIENREFHVYLQFVMDMHSRRFCGAEVLSRWHNQQEGVLSPGHYIDDMRAAGMMEMLDFYIFDKTCALLEEWKETAWRDLYLSCNFTRSTLSSENFSQRFDKILAKYSFDRSNLTVELTEDSLARDRKVTYKNILAIKEHGCKVALDDMGSGYTSFGDLCDYPIDVIKIDRAIVERAASRRGNAVLIGMITMAHALGIRVLCEGVETDAERTRVQDAGCDYIQGFLYSRVLPVDEAMEFYHAKKH